MHVNREQIIEAMEAWENEDPKMGTSEQAKLSPREEAELRADDLIRNLGVRERSRPVKAEFKKRNGEYTCSLVSSNGNSLFNGSGWDTLASMTKAIAAVQESEIILVEDDI